MTAGFGAVLTALAFLLIVGLVVVSVLTVGDGGGPIRKTRVDRFAARQVLPITPVNGEQVVRALGITHRWRRLGLMSGFAVAATVAAMQARIEVNFLAMFLGWFVGSLVAEWRISAPPAQTERRVASLGVRSLSNYLTPSTRITAGAVVGLLVGALIVTAPSLLEATARAPWLTAAVETLLGGVALWAVSRRVVGRPQPAASSDAVETDNALRGHALTVIAGSAIALATQPLGTLIALVPGLDPAYAALIGFGLLVAGLLLGWYVAAQSPSVRERALAARMARR